MASCFFYDDNKPGNTKQIVFSVKSGHIPPAHVRELRGVIERENAALGVLVTLNEPTKPMRAEAAQAGSYQSPLGSSHPRMQILTIEELLDGKSLDYPGKLGFNVTLKKAVIASPKARAKRDREHQGLLFEKKSKTG